MTFDLNDLFISQDQITGNDQQLRQLKSASSNAHYAAVRSLKFIGKLATVVECAEGASSMIEDGTFHGLGNALETLAAVIDNAGQIHDAATYALHRQELARAASTAQQDPEGSE